MRSVILILFSMLAVGVTITKMPDFPIDPLTAALVVGIIVFLYRAKRAAGISLHLDELLDEQSDRYDDWRELGKLKPEDRAGERNRVARKIDATNEDIDNLKKIRW